MRHFLNTVISFFRIPAAVAEQAAMLVTRLVIGQAFMLTGWGKLHSLEGVTKYFTDLGIPMPGANALLVANLEFFGGIAIALGLGTRIAAALLASTMVVALLTADKSDFLKSFAFWPDKSLVDITPFAYLIFLLWLVGRGGGVISIDRQLLAWWIRTQVPSASKPSAPPADPVN